MSERSAYKRFEGFLRRLVAVPKTEIDEQEAQYQARAQKKKADRGFRSA